MITLSNLEMLGRKTREFGEEILRVRRQRPTKNSLNENTSRNQT